MFTAALAFSPAVAGALSAAVAIDGLRR